MFRTVFKHETNQYLTSKRIQIVDCIYDPNKDSWDAVKQSPRVFVFSEKIPRSICNWVIKISKMVSNNSAITSKRGLCFDYCVISRVSCTCSSSTVRDMDCLKLRNLRSWRRSYRRWKNQWQICSASIL